MTEKMRIFTEKSLHFLHEYGIMMKINLYHTPEENFMKHHTAAHARSRRILYVLIPVLLTALLCTACQKAEEEETEMIQVYEGETTPISTEELSAYIITRSDTGSDDEIDAAIALRKALDPVVSVGITTDFINERRGETVPEENLEILVGNTNRADTVTIANDLRYHDFAIEKTDYHIVIVGGSDEATVYAVDFFIRNFISETGVSLPAEPFVYRHDYAIDTLTLNGVAIADYTILQSQSDTSLAERLSDTFTYKTGYVLPVKKKDAEGPIIQLALAELPEDTCQVRVENDVVVLEGSNADTLLCAAKYFLIDILSLNDTTSSTRDVTISETRSFDCNAITDMKPVVYTVNMTDKEPSEAIKNAITQISQDSLTTLEPQVIEIPGGEYRITESITLDASVSGTKYAPLTIRSSNGEEVRFIGAITVDPSEAYSVEDEAILSRVVNQNGAANLHALDLSPYLETVEKPYYKGSSLSDNPMQVYMNENALTRSRYPNDISGKGYLYSGKELSYSNYVDGPITFNYSPSDTRSQYWSDEAIKDLYVFGFLAYDWTNDQIKVASLDRENNVVTTISGTTYEPNTGSRFYFYNLLEEIDIPGESYIDTTARIIYFFPYAEETETIYISVLEEPMLVMNNVNNVVIDGLSFLYTRARAVEGTDLDSVRFQNCTIAHCSGNAMTLSGMRITIDYCSIYDTWTGGIYISGGDRDTLTSGESVISNCTIHDVNRSGETYKPGISANSVGLQILNNCLYGNTHEMIGIGTNDVVIQYNEIYDCVTESSDMGAIYWGRNPTILGIDIGYNYFHDIGNSYGGIGQESVYCDDGSMGPWLHDNIFYRASTASAAYKSHAAIYTLMENNYILSTPSAFKNSSWNEPKWSVYMYSEQWERIAGVAFESDAWHEQYDGTIWGNLWKHFSWEAKRTISGARTDDMSVLEENALYKPYDPQEDSTNVMRNNIYFDIDMMYEEGKIWSGGDLVDENNIEVNASYFVSYAAKDFTLTDEALAAIREQIPDFRAIDMSLIGPGGRD